MEKPKSQPSEQSSSPNLIQRLCHVYNEKLRSIIRGEIRDYSPFELGRPSTLLITTGMPDLPIQMSVHRLVDKKLQTNHPFSLVSVVHMPEYLANHWRCFKVKREPIVRLF